MATTSSAHMHIRKRQYQPSIKSYFNSGGERSQSSRSPLSPPIDAATQASLLSVGMRVRKSVPEGYKTHKTLGVNGFPFPSTSPTTSTAPSRPSYNTASSRELMPFCGLHKTGGLAQQPQHYVPSSSAPAAIWMEDANTPGLTSSQQTLPSTQSSSISVMQLSDTTSKKRAYEEEIEDDMDAFFDEVDAVVTAKSARVIARPKGSLRLPGAAVRTGMSAGEDFDEAPFLAPMDVDEGQL